MQAWTCSIHLQHNINIQKKKSNSIILFFTMLIVVSGCASKKNQDNPVYNKNAIENALEICNQALNVFNRDNLKAPEALVLLNEGLDKVSLELDSHRNSYGNLSIEFAGYESKLANYLAFRKTLREQSYIINARKETNTSD